MATSPKMDWEPTETSEMRPGRSTSGYGAPNTSMNAAPELGRGFGEMEEPGILASFVSSVRDVFFPEKLPPLQLESTPVAVGDPMAVKRDPVSTGISVGLHVVVIALIAWALARGVKMAAPVITKVVTPIDLPVHPPKAPPKATMIGGGGGQRGPTPVTKGSPPKFAEHQIVPPSPPPPQQPKIAIQPTVEVQKDVKMASNLPQVGMPNSPLVGMSMGNGSGTGLGSGSGSGIGPGSGGNIGGGVHHIGGGVSAPQLIYQIDPEFSEEARKAKVAGNVLVTLIVDATGHPQRVRVLRGIGMGLDENAVAAVKQYRFKPAMEGGKPVPVEVNIEVNFQIF